MKTAEVPVSTGSYKHLFKSDGKLVDGVRLTKAAMGPKVRKVSKDDNELEVVVARVGVRDLDGDIFEPGSYHAKDSGPYMMPFHHSRSDIPIGIGPIREEGEEVIQTVRFFNSQLAKDTMEAIVEGKDSVEFSYTFWPKDYIWDPNHAWGIIFKDVDMYETSPVLKGASIDTGVKELMKAFRDNIGGKLNDSQKQELNQMHANLKAAGIIE